MNAIDSQIRTAAPLAVADRPGRAHAVQVDDPRIDAMNAELCERLDALDSEEYRSSDSYRVGDRVLVSSLFWLGLGILVWVLTLVLWT